MQKRKHHDRQFCTGGHQRWIDTIASNLKGFGKLSGGAGKRCDGVGAYPFAVAADADRINGIALWRSRRYDVTGSHTRHVVLGGLAPKKDHEADSIVHAPTVLGTTCRTRPPHRSRVGNGP